MKKLFYVLTLLVLVGCGSNEGTLPENLRMYTSTYDSQDLYGTDEIKPFQGLHGNVKQISYPLHNGGNETITFHRNGFIDIRFEKLSKFQRYYSTNKSSRTTSLCTVPLYIFFFRP